MSETAANPNAGKRYEDLPDRDRLDANRWHCLEDDTQEDIGPGGYTECSEDETHATEALHASTTPLGYDDDEQFHDVRAQEWVYPALDNFSI